MGFIFIAYNLKRLMNIVGIEKLITVVGDISSNFKHIIWKSVYISYLQSQKTSYRIFSLNWFNNLQIEKLHFFDSEKLVDLGL